jgi:hypothetical protein
VDINGYRIAPGILREWAKRLIPELEWFYFEKSIPGMDMFSLSSLKYSAVPLDIRTSYGTWSLSSETKFYTKMSPQVFSSLSASLQTEIIKQQWETGRGLVFELEVLMELAGINRHSYTGVSIADNKEIILLNLPLWESFSEMERHRFLVNYGTQWVNDKALWSELEKDSQNELKEKYPCLADKIDTFPSSNGPNCLAAVAGAITGDETFFNSWMKEEAFLRVIKDANYEPRGSETITEGDVLIWFNESKQVIHSCYVLNSEFAFNKQGQTMFNPWQILKLPDIINSWKYPGTYSILYRKPK